MTDHLAPTSESLALLTHWRRSVPRKEDRSGIVGCIVTDVTIYAAGCVGGIGWLQDAVDFPPVPM